ncbi:uncharacterized protein OCT59_005962 [Rhizophagus irregularis]|uniref:uncharacterized protein n=1 Tax=Rhizophagus irregularis TaxID=588596 RepID=UPI0019FADA68|nr:hypothetical protein OCT59_005962 [Rhizophagus irregularis]GET64090.1 hypothetical protein GLOIN_2v1768243 [Rhizophagus irregularis DAOM 181602=DAOM 197198]
MVNETNNLIERFFFYIKVEIFAWKEKKRIDTLINILINQCPDFFTIRFYTQINQQIFNEKKFNEIKSRELKACEIAENNMIDIIDPMNGYCIVKSQSNSSKVYEVYLCDVTVKTSPLLCKHIRAAASVLGGLEIWNLSLDSERIAFYQNNNMMQDQYTLNSNTANQFHEETPDQKNKENSSGIPNKIRGKRPTNVLGKNKLNVKRRKDDNDIIENALKESTQI